MPARAASSGCGAVVARAQHHAAALGADAVDRGLHDDAQQRVAVEALAERLADALDRLLQARALELELLQAGLELAGHAVELAPERGELVVALGGDLDGEVARAERAGGREQAVDLRLQRARGGEREGEGADEEGEEDEGDAERAVSRSPRRARRRQQHARRSSCASSKPGVSTLADLVAPCPLISRRRRSSGCPAVDASVERAAEHLVALAHDDVDVRRPPHQLAVLVRGDRRELDRAERRCGRP